MRNDKCTNFKNMQQYHVFCIVSFPCCQIFVFYLSTYCLLGLYCIFFKAALQRAKLQNIQEIHLNGFELIGQHL